MESSANIAQLVEQLIRNEQAVGSSPSVGSIEALKFVQGFFFESTHSLISSVRRRWKRHFHLWGLRVGFIIIGFAIVTGCSKPLRVIGDEIPLERSPISVSTALLDAPFDAPIAVTGTVREVCPDDGCWLVITDRANLLRVEPADVVGEVPQEWSGRSLRIDGKLTQKIILPSSKGYVEYERLCESGNRGKAPVIVMIARRIELVGKEP